jgi:ribokinase
MNILVVGSINMDLVAAVDRLPQSGETVSGERLETIPGGKGANQAVAAARLGAVAHMIGRVGDDVFGPQLLSALAAAGVRTDGVESAAETSSGAALICVDRTGQNCITVVPGANGTLSPDALSKHESLFANAKIVLVQLETPMATASAAAVLARRFGAFTILDPAPAPHNGLPDDLYGVDLLTPNQSEAETLTGIALRGPDEAARTADALIRRGARNVVLKLGAHGAWWTDDKGRCGCVPAFAVQAVDATAAGDAFTAALGVALAEGRSLADAVRFACAAGALAATRFGAQIAMPKRDEVDALCR